MVKGIFIATLVLLTLFFLFYRLISNGYRQQRIRLIKIVEKDIYKKIENIKTIGYEENGWKNNFPSQTGWDKSTIFVGNDFLFISPKSDFPFLFKSELQPFIIANDISRLKDKLHFDRVYKPLNVDRLNRKNDFVITIRPSGPLGQIKIHLTFKNLETEDLEIIEQLKSWC